MIGRRLVLGGGGVVLVMPGGAPALATPNEAAAAMAAVKKGAVPQPGRVTLDLAQMVENGNAVGIVVSATPPDGTHVVSLHVFADGNPLPNVVNAVFGPASFAPKLSTRIRLATSQTVTALAVMADGTCWTDGVTVMVTLAACLE